MVQRGAKRRDYKGDDSKKHLFGGCDRLANQYRTVGLELLQYEHRSYSYGYRSFSAFREFREGVAFIPREVLESYLEDLLDLTVPEERLFVEKESSDFNHALFCFGGIAVAMAAGLMAAYAGASIYVSFALTMIVVSPFAILWHRSPSSALARRMAFANVVSTEVNRRRGVDKDGGEAARFAFDEIFSNKAGKEVPGAARTISKPRLIH